MTDGGQNGRIAGPRLGSVRDGMVAGLRRVGLAQPALPSPPEPGRPGSSQALDGSELAARREALAARFAELQWDLGGVAYEMASRDHFRLDVLTARAAELQQVESNLAETERLLKLEQAGAAGACPSCGSLYARGADYCWHCGLALMPSGAAAPVPPEDA
jgi:hypothetical protein